jgi:phage terminase large subunit GpA-like protein
MKDIIQEALTNSYTKLDLRPMWEWASDNISLPQGKYSKPGRFNVDSSRYLLEPMKALQDFGVHTVVFQACNKIGKTMLGHLFLTWAVAQRPGHMVWYAKTKDQAQQELTDRIRPLLQSNRKTLGPYLPTFDREMAEDRIPFRTMDFTICGCSKNTLQQLDAQYVIGDEVWTWDEGWLEWAKSRLIAFKDTGNSKFLITTQGGLAESELDNYYLAGDQSIWSVPCPQCKEYIKPVWSEELIKFDTSLKGARNEYLFNDIYKTIRLVCPHCKKETQFKNQKEEDECKVWWNEQFRPTHSHKMAIGLSVCQPFHYFVIRG